VQTHPTPLDSIPDPRTIRARLGEMHAEREMLRALLRLWEQRQCGRELLRRRRRPIPVSPPAGQGAGG
jgi:hypothetical protein